MKMKASNSGTELVEKSFIHYVPIIIVGILICGVPSAILNSCAGIYYPVMAEDFGVPVSQISMWRTLGSYYWCYCFAFGRYLASKI